MQLSTDTEVYQNLLKKGSILKALRSNKGLGFGLMAGGAVWLAFLGEFGIYMVVAAKEASMRIFGLVILLPGVITLLGGFYLKKKRDTSYMGYIRENGGPDEAELEQVERELASPNVKIIGFQRSGSSVPAMACFITENYFVTTDCYVRRLSDIIAAGYSQRMGQREDGVIIWGMVILSARDDEGMFMTFGAPTEAKKTLCTEIIAALHEKNPRIARGEYVVCDGKIYDILHESKELLKLYHEGNLVSEYIPKE